MTTQATAVYLLFCLLVVQAIWIFGWRVYILDSYRIRLFDRRERLFRRALAGGALGFDTQIYRNLESWINAHLGLSSRMTLTNYLLFRFRHPDLARDKVDPTDLLRQAAERLPKDDREWALGTIAAVEIETGRFIALSNLLITIPVVFWVIAVTAMQAAMSAIDRRMPVIVWSEVKSESFSPVSRAVTPFVGVGLNTETEMMEDECLQPAYDIAY